MADISHTCQQLGITVCGGHTEITARLDRPIVVGQMLGEVASARLVNKARLAVGDQILMTQGVAIEGTALLAREKAQSLRGRVDDDVIARAARLLLDPGISVVEAALTAAAAGVVHAMHDPTEGGLAGGVHELAMVSGLGLRIFGERIPVFPETRAICHALGLDPLRLIASGALLIGVPPSDVDGVATALESRCIPVARLGQVEPAGAGVRMDVHGKSCELAFPDRDEIAKVFEA